MKFEIVVFATVVFATVVFATVVFATVVFATVACATVLRFCRKVLPAGVQGKFIEKGKPIT